MIKIISFLVLIAVIVQRSTAGPDEMVKIIADCKTSTNATDTDVMNLKNKVKPASKGVKCLVTCMTEKMGLISNNTINKDGCLKLAKTLPNSNEKTLQSVSEIVDECKGIQDADKCEYGAKVAECMSEAGAKRSLTNIFM